MDKSRCEQMVKEVCRRLADPNTGAGINLWYIRKFVLRPCDEYVLLYVYAYSYEAIADIFNPITCQKIGNDIGIEISVRKLETAPHYYLALRDKPASLN